MNSGITVGEAGERETIRLLSQWVMRGKQANGDFGVGDDCAITNLPVNSTLVTTTDLLIEGTHFLRDASTSWHAVGRKAAGANISDLAAMGASPVALLISVGLPHDFLLEDLMSLYRGIYEYGEPLNARVIGGDTTRSDTVCISVAALGWKPSGTADCLRSDAQPGDNVYVTGALGASRAGVEVMLDPALRNKMGEDLSLVLIDKHHSPEPRVAAGKAIAACFTRAAIIDISDSLFNELCLMATASEVEIALNIDAIPVDPHALKFCSNQGHDPQQHALYSGEEYELLFAAAVTPEELRDKFYEAGVDCPVTHLGTVNPGSGVRLLKGGHPVDPKDETFVHFN